MLRARPAPDSAISAADEASSSATYVKSAIDAGNCRAPARAGKWTLEIPSPTEATVHLDFREEYSALVCGQGLTAIVSTGGYFRALPTYEETTIDVQSRVCDSDRRRGGS